MLQQPNRPMAMASATGADGAAQTRTYTCQTAPGETFDTEAEMKAHYRTPLHHHNLKRKVAGLAPLSRAAFEEREAAAAAAPVPSGRLTTAERRERREARREARAEASAANPRSKAAFYRAAEGAVNEEALARLKIDAAPSFDEGSDLFSRHHSPDLASNLAYMARTHGFYVPRIDYCVDVAGLITYLQVDPAPAPPPPPPSPQPPSF